MVNLMRGAYPFPAGLLPILIGALASAASEGVNAVNAISTEDDQSDTEILTNEVSDEALENAAGTSPGLEGGSSLWSTITVAGCTCMS